MRGRFRKGLHAIARQSRATTIAFVPAAVMIALAQRRLGVWPLSASKGVIGV